MNLHGFTLRRCAAHSSAERINLPRKQPPMGDSFVFHTPQPHETWQSALNLIGYAEEWTNHISGYKTRPRPARRKDPVSFLYKLYPRAGLTYRNQETHAWNLKRLSLRRSSP